VSIAALIAGLRHGGRRSTAPPTPQPITIESIRRYDIREGDTLVLTTKRHLTAEQREELMRIWREGVSPTVRCCILGPDFEIAILREGEHE
jgi:hypothetical protein